MFYTIYWPIPVEVLVRVKYPMKNNAYSCKPNNAYSCKPLFYYIKRGSRGYSLHGHVCIMRESFLYNFEGVKKSHACVNPSFIFDEIFVRQGTSFR